MIDCETLKWKMLHCYHLIRAARYSILVKHLIAGTKCLLRVAHLMAHLIRLLNYLMRIMMFWWGKALDKVFASECWMHVSFLDQNLQCAGWEREQCMINCRVRSKSIEMQVTRASTFLRREVCMLALAFSMSACSLQLMLASQSIANLFESSTRNEWIE